MPESGRPPRVVGALERLRLEHGLTRRELALRVGRTHQWLDEIVAGRSRISVDDAGALLESVGARIEVVSGRADQALLAALEADADLDAEWRDAVWSLYLRGKERRRGGRAPLRRAVDRFIEADAREAPGRKRRRAAASSE